MLIEVERVFNPRGVIHYPCTTETNTKYDCGRKVHGTINKTVLFYLYSKYGKSLFLVLELKTRLRKFNELINYPVPIDSDVDDDQDEDLHIPAPTDTLLQSDEEKKEASVSSVMNDSDDDSGQTMDDNTYLPLTADVVELVQDYEDDDYDSESSSQTGEEIEQPIEEQIRAATDLSFNETLYKIISDDDMHKKR